MIIVWQVGQMCAKISKISEIGMKVCVDWGIIRLVSKDCWSRLDSSKNMLASGLFGIFAIELYRNLRNHNAQIFHILTDLASPPGVALFVLTYIVLVKLNNHNVQISDNLVDHC